MSRLREAFARVNGPRDMRVRLRPGPERIPDRTGRGTRARCRKRHPNDLSCRVKPECSFAPGACCHARALMGA